MGFGLLVVSGAALLVHSAVSELKPGRVVEGLIGGNQVHAHSLPPMTGGDFLEVSVEQRGIDLTVSLLDDLGRPLIVADSIGLGDAGREVLPVLVEDPGIYHVEIKPTNPQDAPANYALRYTVSQPSPQDVLRAVAAEELTKGRHAQERGSFDAALSFLASAVDHAEEAKDRRQLAEALYRRGNVLWLSARYAQARDAFIRAGQEYRSQGFLLGQAHALDMEGNVLKDLKDLQGALEARQKAYDFYERVGGRQGDLGRAVVSDKMAQIYATLGTYGRARTLYEEALAIWPPGLDTVGRIQTLNGLGVLYLSLAQADQAQAKFEEALHLTDQIGLAPELACTTTLSLSNLGQAHAQKGDQVKALYYFRRAFSLSPSCNKVFYLAAIANQTGSVYFDRPASALNDYFARIFFQQALNQAKDVTNSTNAQSGLAGLLLREKKAAQAKQLFDDVLAIRRKERYLLGIVGALYGRAQAEVAMGDLETAQDSIAESLREIEKLRLGPEGDFLRASLLASREQNFELSVSTYMAQHQREPTSGFDAKAFEVGETARARVLMDWLGGDWRAESESPELSKAEKALVQDLQDRRRELSQLEAAAKEDPSEETDGRIEALDREVRDLVLKRQALQAAHRTVNLESSEPWTLREIQEEVLDDRTLLLSYWFGGKTERSYLWAVDSDSIKFHQFRFEEVAQIQRLASKVQREISDSSRDIGSREILHDLDELSRRVLPPEIAALLGNRRLLIVADGELQSIPFQVLQDPRFPLLDAEKGWVAHVPLVEGHSIVTLPSASMLGVLRRELAGRKLPLKELAVIADPIFNANDDRVSGSEDQSEARSAASDNLLQGLRRLSYSGSEAAAILEMVDPNKRFSAIGFEANVDNVVTAGLGDYRIVHIATHGFSAPLQDLAGLALSGVQGDLAARRGFLHAFEIARMDLPVELVVLSACDTGVGESFAGEGVFNLSRAFFYAGSRRVVVTLWQVHDEATSEFMKLFYEAMLDDDLEPSEALRSAQAEMRRIPRWQHPYFWSGFVLQGEW